jgi:hypothetical protein
VSQSGSGRQTERTPSFEDTVPDLSLEDTLNQRRRGLPDTRGTVSGYNPYDAAPDPSAPGRKTQRKRTDLRKLSEWIRVQRQVEQLRQSEQEPPQASPPEGKKR